MFITKECKEKKNFFFGNAGSRMWNSTRVKTNKNEKKFFFTLGIWEVYFVLFVYTDVPLCGQEKRVSRDTQFFYVTIG